MKKVLYLLLLISSFFILFLEVKAEDTDLEEVGDVTTGEVIQQDPVEEVVEGKTNHFTITKSIKSNETTPITSIIPDIQPNEVQDIETTIGDEDIIKIEDGAIVTNTLANGVVTAGETDITIRYGDDVYVIHVVVNEEDVPKELELAKEETVKEEKTNGKKVKNPKTSDYLITLLVVLGITGVLFVTLKQKKTY